MELSEEESELYGKFKVISDMAYKREPLKSYASVLEQLIWYKMKEVYDEYRRGEVSLGESQKRKDKISAFYKQQMRIQNFDKEHHDEIYKNIREADNLLKEILKDEENKIPEKELTKKLVDYVVKITGIVPIKTEYEKNYEVK